LRWPARRNSRFKLEGMLQGDALSIQLFIAAAAISALSVAMTQAGWTNRWFIWGMFGLAALLFAATAGWPYFDSRIPLINDALRTIVSSRLAWFFMGIIPALVAGMLISDSLRRRREAPKLPTEWSSITSSMETLARRDLIDRYRFVQQQVFDNARTALDLEQKKAELNKAAMVVDESQRSDLIDRLLKTSAEYLAVCKQSQPLVDKEEDCREALRMNLHHQLRQGELIAKGFLAPHMAGASEIIIPKEEWRFLSLDDAGDQALGPNFEYIAVLVGKANR
jgi:hypothetical protein